MRYLLAILCAVLGFGCASQKMTHGIPNFAVVKPGVYRGGQPTLEGWRYLKDVLGVSDIYKLNLESEDSDRDAVALGMVVHYIPVNIWQQCGLQKMPANFGIEGAAVGGSFTHCEHGRERTGAWRAKIRMKEGWSKAAAKKEMLALGFRRSPLSWGLWKYVNNEVP